MKTRQFDSIMAWFSAIALFCLLFIMTDAQAWQPKDPKQKQTQTQNQKQAQHQAQGQQQQAKSVAQSVSTSSAVSKTMSSSSNEGNSLTVNQNHESGPADAVLVPNNNTESCLRVFGLMFGNKDGSGMLGLPFRSKVCDYEQAADDAFAGGEREIGWFWKCHNPTLYKPFRDKGESKEQAIQDCTARMVGPITLRREYEALRDQFEFIQNERQVERERFVEERNRIQKDCAESNERVLEACVSK